MRYFIFWWIIVPSAVAFILGLVANISKTLADRIVDNPNESPEETPVVNDTSAI